MFRLSAEVLRAAGGQVRCGRCGEVFNALARLAEDASAFPAGESPLEMETRADEILHSAAVPAVIEAATPQEPEDLAAADAEFAQLQVLELYDDDRPAAPSAAPTKATEPATGAGDADLISETSLEFTLPPGELDRIFVESKRRPLPSIPSASGTEAKIPPPSHAETVAPPGSRVSGLEVSEDVQREMLAVINDAQLPEIVPRSRGLPFALWVCAAILLTLALSAQMIHENREWLAAHGPMSSSLRGVYAALGIALPEPANLTAYQLRQWGVTGDPAANGTLRVRASILNTAAQFQPYPLLRVTLSNRFGTRIGAREFEPAEYLGKPTVRMLAPGERVDATLDILDPGKDAEGFEIDVCLRGIDKKISCAGDVATQTKQ